MKLAVVGAGKLGLSLLEGLLRQGVLLPGDVGVLEADARRCGEICDRLGVRSLQTGDLVHAPRMLLALQPRVFGQTAGALAQPGVGYLSTMAGVSTATLSRRLGTRRVVRAMPNLGATIGLSQTAICAPKDAHEGGDFEFARALFSAVGQVYELDEELFDVFTALSGSGPAFAAVFAEGLADGAVRMGMPRPLASELAARVLSTSGELLRHRAHPGQLKDEVSSPGGTSIAGVEALEAGGVRAAAIAAVRAAARRSRELGRDQE